MKKILVVSNNNTVIQTVQIACRTFASYFDPEFFSNTEEAISFIDYELPEIKVLDFTNPEIDSHRILSTINSDPWLHNGGIIAVVSNAKEVQNIEEKKDPNILIVQTINTFKDNFTRLLRILWSNQQFLFNRGLQEQIGIHETGSFICGNDPIDIRLYTNFLVNYLYCSNRIGQDGRYALQTSLMELLTNAIEHGNCNISYEEKTKYLESGGNILQLIREKQKDPSIAAKKIHISYVIGKDKSKFKICDEGNGFDWKRQLSTDFSEETHGRGVKISSNLVSNLIYNEKGNEVTIEINNLQNAANTIPGIMIPFATIRYENNQIVCRQNDPTNDLFFIVSGRYAVYSDKKLVSVLTPNDMFIGEMAFLLNDRRSATILSIDEGKLIRIPKVSFLNLIRKNPHYGIFLSKLIAQRLVRQTQRTIALTKELSHLKDEIEKQNNLEE